MRKFACRHLVKTINTESNIHRQMATTCFYTFRQMKYTLSNKRHFDKLKSLCQIKEKLFPKHDFTGIQSFNLEITNKTLVGSNQIDSDLI